MCVNTKIGEYYGRNKLWQIICIVVNIAKINVKDLQLTETIQQTYIPRALCIHPIL